MGDQPVARPLPTQASMPRMGFELTTPVLERVKTVHALDRVATAIGSNLLLLSVGDHEIIRPSHSAFSW
jgi:hypothetical protein